MSQPGLKKAKGRDHLSYLPGDRGPAPLPAGLQHRLRCKCPQRSSDSCKPNPAKRQVRNMERVHLDHDGAPAEDICLASDNRVGRVVLSRSESVLLWLFRAGRPRWFNVLLREALKHLSVLQTPLRMFPAKASSGVLSLAEKPADFFPSHRE